MHFGYVETCGHICSRAQPIVGAQNAPAQSNPAFSRKHCLEIAVWVK